MNGPHSTPEASPGRVKPLDWAQAAGTAEPVLRAIEGQVRLRRRRRLLAGGATVVLLLAAGLARRPAPAPAADLRGPVTTAVVLLPSRQTLPDGSIVELRPGSAITVEFSAEVRHVTLQRGEAHFQVTPDAARPFVVAAAGVGVRAVGTAFSVQLGARAIDVLVTEGRVAVAEAAAPAPLAVVDAGHRVIVDVASPGTSAPQASAVSEHEMAERLAWRVPRLEFNATPLAGVVAVFNRHATGDKPVHLALADPALGTLPLSGVIRADNVGVLLNILDTSYGVKARRGDRGELVLHRPK